MSPAHLAQPPSILPARKVHVSSYQVISSHLIRVSSGHILLWPPPHVLILVSGHQNVLKRLVEAGANIEAQFRGGFTPLYVVR